MKTSHALASIVVLTMLSACNSQKKDEASLPPSADYPLNVCVVSGEKLGSMGKPHVIKHEGTEVQFCCKNCVKDFNADPKKFLAKIEAARTGKK
jgi:YHS domain-containing protein